MKRHDLLVIIPAYNEEESLGEVLKQLERPEISDIADVIIINDASSDDTEALVRQSGHELLTLIYNMGYGSALQSGYKYATRRRYRYVIQMDADGQHDIKNIPLIYETLKTPDETGSCPDIVLGSRFLYEGNELKPTLGKEIAIAYFRAIIKLFTGIRISDPTSGLQGLSYRTFNYFAGFDHFDDRYPDANMLTQMLLLGCRLKEVPAIMHERKSGRSMHSGIIRQIIYMLRMTITVFAVGIRYGIMKEDKGVLDDVSF